MAKKENVEMVRYNGRVRFSVNERITEREAGEIQEELGYHPFGYGFHSFRRGDGWTAWMCDTNQY